MYEIGRQERDGASGGLFGRWMLRRLKGAFAWHSAKYAAGINPVVRLGEGASFPHGFNGVHITGIAVIGKRCTILQQVTIGLNVPRRAEDAPVIGDDVFIGAGAKIIGKCYIGDGARIGAGVVLVNAQIPQGVTIVNKSAYNLTDGRNVYPDRAVVT